MKKNKEDSDNSDSYDLIENTDRDSKRNITLINQQTDRSQIPMLNTQNEQEITNGISPYKKKQNTVKTNETTKYDFADDNYSLQMNSTQTLYSKKKFNLQDDNQTNILKNNQQNNPKSSFITPETSMTNYLIQQEFNQQINQNNNNNNTQQNNVYEEICLEQKNKQDQNQNQNKISNSLSSSSGSYTGSSKNSSGQKKNSIQKNTSEDYNIEYQNSELYGSEEENEKKLEQIKIYQQQEMDNMNKSQQRHSLKKIDQIISLSKLNGNSPQNCQNQENKQNFSPDISFANSKQMMQLSMQEEYKKRNSGGFFPGLSQVQMATSQFNPKMKSSQYFSKNISKFNSNNSLVGLTPTNVERVQQNLLSPLNMTYNRENKRTMSRSQREKGSNSNLNKKGEYSKGFLLSDILVQIPLVVYYIINESSSDFLLYLGYLLEFFIFLKIFSLKDAFKRLERIASENEKIGQIFPLFTLWLQILIMAHIMGLLYHGVAVIEIETIGEQNTWLHTQDLIDKSWFEKYLSSLHWSVSTMCTVFLYMPQTKIELLFAIFSILIMTGMFGYALNTIGIILTDLDRKTKVQKAERSLINRFFKKRQIPQRLRERIIKYIEFQYSQSKWKQNQEEQQILSKMSKQLQNEILKEINKHHIQKFGFLLNSFTQEKQDKIIQIIQEEYYSPDEYILKNDCIHNIYIISKGTVEIVLQKIENQKGQQGHVSNKIIVKQLKQGDILGVEHFFSGQSPKYSIKSLESCEIIKIERSKFLKIFDTQDQDYEKLCMLKDYYIQNINDKLKIYNKCIICGIQGHQFFNCSTCYYQGDINQIIYDYKTHNLQMRGKIERQPDKTYSALESMLSNQIAIEEIYHEDNQDMELISKVYQYQQFYESYFQGFRQVPQLQKQHSIQNEIISNNNSIQGSVRNIHIPKPKIGEIKQSSFKIVRRSSIKQKTQSGFGKFQFQNLDVPKMSSSQKNKKSNEDITTQPLLKLTKNLSHKTNDLFSNRIKEEEYNENFLNTIVSLKNITDNSIKLPKGDHSNKNSIRKKQDTDLSNQKSKSTNSIKTPVTPISKDRTPTRKSKKKYSFLGLNLNKIEQSNQNFSICSIEQSVNNPTKSLSRTPNITSNSNQKQKSQIFFGQKLDKNNKNMCMKSQRNVLLKNNNNLINNNSNQINNNNNQNNINNTKNQQQNYNMQNQNDNDILVKDMEQLKEIDTWDLLNFDLPFKFNTYMVYNNMETVVKETQKKYKRIQSQYCQSSPKIKSNKIQKSQSSSDNNSSEENDEVNYKVDNINDQINKSGEQDDNINIQEKRLTDFMKTGLEIPDIANKAKQSLQRRQSIINPSMMAKSSLNYKRNNDEIGNGNGNLDMLRSFQVRVNGDRKSSILLNINKLKQLSSSKQQQDSQKKE